MAIMKTINELEDRLERMAERFAFHHPYLAFLVMFFGIPCFILTAVVVFTTLLELPLALIFGWL